MLTPGACLAVERAERAGPEPGMALPDWVPAFQVERVARVEVMQPRAQRSPARRGGGRGRWDRVSVHGRHLAAAEDVETPGPDEDGGVLVNA